ncbi:hypothetical protein [Terricaulis sp.]|uniref:hypothetical protein n=1 Tax=Terricaulis sp. TaxID=2768686 RepID=UPI0037839C25
MRNWLFHPLIFYPLAVLLAVVVIAISVKPQAWPRPPAPVAAQHAQGALTYAGEGFNAPDDPPQQHLTVTRDFIGRPLTLRIAVLPNQPSPAPAEKGVLILMTPQDAAAVSDRPVTVEITYNALPVNAANALAISLQGEGDASWVTQPTPPLPGTLRYELPARAGVNAIGLRAISNADDYAYGLEITRIRIIPHA